MSAAHPAWLQDLPGVRLHNWRWGWTTAAGPDFHSPPETRAHTDAVNRLVAAVGLGEGAWVRQVHGGAVIRAEQPGLLGEADAIWTTEPGLGVVGRSADCPLILVAGANADGGGLYGFAHASWRSTVAGITAGLLAEMTLAGLRPHDAVAVISPSAGPCCYEVGPEVQAAALAALGAEAPQLFPRLGPKTTFDLWRANSAQLTAAGLVPQHIFNAGVCTICGGDKYHSYRRQGNRAGRIAAICGGA